MTRPGAIFDEPAVVRRLERKGALRAVTGSSTVAAAVMVGAALLALVVANTPLYDAVEHVLGLPLVVGVGRLTVSLTVEQFVNDFLMAVFFLLVGIELKYETTVGQLRRPRQAALPMLAAVGGVTVPALIYLAVNLAQGGEPRGWAVPIATDIAFALGVVSLLGERISPATKVFFQTLAIADDILAIVVIALFYGQVPQVGWCLASLALTGALVALNRARVYSVAPYVAVGLVLWACMFNSGVHATLAGVILAFALPSRSDVRLSELGGWLERRARDLEDAYDDEHHVLGQHDFTDGAWRTERVMHHVTPPLQRMERYVTVFVNFLVLPLFAFVNAELHLVGENFGALLASPVAHGAYLGAVAGKPVGIILVTWLLVRLGFARLPRGMDWPQVVAVGLMGGVGFTMSILITGLAFTDPADAIAAKCAILLASLTSAALGTVFARLAIRDGGPGARRRPPRGGARRHGPSRPPRESCPGQGVS
ncbi:Na+/H+ antiporter NhaA [Thermophilibacter mediterraneus]|uniref:Na+/H+ antiporter NhaA n=1 Tax=Thermophilibacter mediterraneus TaxID=1871031 RepID=UPI00092FEEDB|nr:Na+/H+ antiporter NhaA [Thermophilibacter mediterraneus]